MSLSLAVGHAVLAAEAPVSDPAIPAWGIGVIVLGILLLLLAGLLAFAGGREHS